MRALGLLIATAAGAGYAPIAPGTAGSAVGLIVLVGIRMLPVRFEVPILIGVTLVGVWAATVGEREAGQEDPGLVVIDEVAGMLLTMLWVPLTLWTAMIGFFAFRVFDIVKPFPASSAERLPSGWGIMADDIVAGAYAAITLNALLWLAPSLAAP